MTRLARKTVYCRASAGLLRIGQFGEILSKNRNRLGLLPTMRAKIRTRSCPYSLKIVPYKHFLNNLKKILKKSIHLFFDNTNYKYKVKSGSNFDTKSWFSWVIYQHLAMKYHQNRPFKANNNAKQNMPNTLHKPQHNLEKVPKTTFLQRQSSKMTLSNLKTVTFWRYYGLGPPYHVVN